MLDAGCWMLDAGYMSKDCGCMYLVQVPGSPKKTNNWWESKPTEMRTNQLILQNRSWEEIKWREFHSYASCTRKLHSSMWEFKKLGTPTLTWEMQLCTHIEYPYYINPHSLPRSLMVNSYDTCILNIRTIVLCVHYLRCASSLVLYSLGVEKTAEWCRINVHVWCVHMFWKTIVCSTTY